ncbi:hypothetical protein L6452_16914 [Arctium lappa]|uniref:Uncharacterized protein n=1 Tax=Arctium lappa TaxID=4217 RepID=A0ACB9C252_ARCLA|nr:hypothetical protein L6452_16914 [Arctium lappa]
MIDTDVDSLIETLKHLINFNHPSQICKTPWIDQLQLLYKELTSLRTFLTRSEETRYTVEKVKALVIRIIDVAIKVEDMVDSFVSSFDNDCFLELDNVMRQIQDIKSEILGFDNHKIQDLVHKGSSSRVNLTVPKEDKIVGFDVEAREILDRLVGNQKQLDVISIVGMGGLGKTTLAKRAYYDPYVVYHFYIRVWVTVSQTYQKHNLLLGICSSLSLTVTNEAATGKLREMIYKRLKGKRYLVVIDDIWSVGAWDDIRICFPDDNIGSRILVTSRLVEVALHIKPDSSPHLLRFLTVEESWDLLQQKVFSEDGSCPKSLKKTGKRIAERCRGLPLAILVISGLLAKTEKTVEWWTRVLDSIGSYLVGDPEQCMNTLALSYNHLPQHLKSCFLYFGAFPEDFEIDVRKLLWLWVAEGFIKSATENIAEEYLIDLVERSLVIVERKRLDGGIKVCRVHDLLHDLCFKKAKEENFLHQIKAYGEQPSSPNTSGCRAIDRRLFIHSYVLDYVFSKPSSSNTRSFLLTSNAASGLTNQNIMFLYSAFKHLRVFEFGTISTPFLPSEIGQLVHLRYLSLSTRGLVIPKSISTLQNIQTLVIRGESFPIDFPFCKDSNMSNLMHLLISPSVRLQHPVALQNIRTISMLHLPVGRQPVLERAPNLRKLGLYVSPQRSGLVFFPPLDFLIHLEKLKIFIDNDYRHGLPTQARFTWLNRLPQNLRKVTFLNCYLPWSDLSELGRLPNLQVLKILCGAFQGPRWDTNDGEFRKLKCLKIQSPELAEWNTDSDHFPHLERLNMNDCRRLKEIPMCLGDIPTMELIELKWPRRSAADSARRIFEEQRSLGNDGLKIIIDGRKEYEPEFLLHKRPTIMVMYSDSSSDESSDEESSDGST